MSLLSMKPYWHNKFISGVSSRPCQPTINKLHLKCHLVLLLLFLVLPCTFYFQHFPPYSHFIPILPALPSSPHLSFLSSLPVCNPRFLPTFVFHLPLRLFPLISSSPQASLTLSCSCRTLVLHHHRSHAHIRTVEMCTLSLRRGSTCVLSLSFFEMFSLAQLEGQERGA